MGASSPVAEASPADAPAAAGEPDEADVERFRKLQEAAARQRRFRKNATRIDKTLEGLGIALSDEQRKRLVETYTAFEDRRNEIWGGSRRIGLYWVDGSYGLGDPAPVSGAYELGAQARLTEPLPADIHAALRTFACRY